MYGIRKTLLTNKEIMQLGKVTKMYSEGYTLEDISKAINVPIETISEWVDKFVIPASMKKKSDA